MKLKAFSIIEIIFILAIISIILAVAVPKLKNIFTQTNTVQIKTTVLLIREGINKEKNRLLLSNSMESLNNLDNGNEKLFDKVLQSPIIEDQNPKANSWVRESSNSYKVYLDDTTTITFTYDPLNNSFDCDYTKPLCKELTH